MTQHTAQFTWGAGAQTVCVAGGFNNWSATATPLHKQADGTFAADVSLPWGEKQAFKYVVDGEWKVREDEAKEWDAAGNMNNVYTAPPAPVSEPKSHAEPTGGVAAAAASHGHSSKPSTDASAPASASGVSPSEPSPTVVAKETPTPAPAPASETAGPTERDQPKHEAAAPAAVAAVPSRTTADTAAPTENKTSPSTLIASSAPGAATGAPILGGVVFPTAHKSPKATETTTIISEPKTTTTTAPTTAPSASSATAVPSTTASTTTPQVAAAPAKKPLAEEPLNVQISKVAAKANIGEAPAPSNTQEHTLAEQASDFASGALAAIGAVVGNAAVAVEKVTGVDIAHLGASPLTIEEAKARGIDVNSLPIKEAETDAVSPVGTAPSASAVSALEEKVQQLKVSSGTSTTGVSSSPAAAGSSRDTTGVAAVPLPKTAEPKTSLPPSGPLPLKDSSDAKQKHDIPAQPETVNNHKRVPQPVLTTVSDKDPKKDRTLAATNTNNSDTAGTKPIGNSPAVDALAEKRKAESDPISTKAASDSPLNQSRVTPNASSTNNAEKRDTSTRAATASNAPAIGATPSTPAKVAEVPVTPAKTAQAPATPAKTVVPNGSSTTGPAAATAATPVSAASTPASTPAKSTHAREKTTDSDIRKRKSSFFTKIKHAFSPKDKEKSAK
ncbi:hypothetical protein IAU60_002637 [Kwoniella sp. DSM 27419]